MIIRATFFGLLLGSVITLFLMQHDARVKEHVGTAFKNLFEASIGCHMQGAVESLNIWQPSLVLRDVRVTPPNEQEQWRWTAQRLIVSCTWWHLFCYGIIDLHVVLEKADIYSACTDGVLAINDHVNRLLFGTSSTIPLFTKSVIYKQSHIHIADTDSSVDVHGTWNSESKTMGNHFKTTVYLSNGSVACNGMAYMNTIHGSLYLDMLYNGQTTEYDIKADGTGVVLPQSACETRCNFTALWEHNQGTMHLVSDDHALTVDAVGTPAHARVQAALPLKHLIYGATHEMYKELEAVCHYDVHTTTNNQERCIEGVWHIDNATYGATSLGNASGTWHMDSDGWHGSLALHGSPAPQIKGTWYWNQNHARLELAVHEDKPISLVQQWCVKPGTTRCTFTYDDAGITSSYAATVFNAYDATEVQLEGNGSYTAGTYELEGTLNNRSYRGSFTRDGVHYTGSLTYGDDPHPLATITAQDATMSGSLDLLCIKEACAMLGMGELQGEGVFQWTIPDYHQVPVTISCKLDHGVLRIPQTYNAINGAQGIIEWDYDTKKIRVRDVHCSLYQGSMRCNQATVLYGGAGYPFFVHVPSVLHGCLLNMQKDLCALVSGHLTYTCTGDDARVTGLLTVDHSELKENIFSDAWVQRFFSGMTFPISHKSVGCDIALQTVAPTHIKTSFLDTTAAIDLHVTNTLASPEVAGTIALGSGSLSFPYKPLYITQGALYFVPGQLYDPVIEFSAKNNIKNHAIAMHVTGSLSKPHVALESWPPLIQEQIVSLLLVGSYQDSLNMVMPALLMNNITALIFGDNHAPHTLNHRFASILDPLKRIRLVPSFTDQTGRGGLRGAIEIDVSDRVHAVIQKNFSLTEDTYFELGYLLSDEINVRLLRDERRDMGAEVEMRWKFGS